MIYKKKKRGAFKAKCVIITAVWRLGQEYGKFKASHNCIPRNYLQIKANKIYIQKRLMTSSWS